jgi:hypothetical protein
LPTMKVAPIGKLAFNCLVGLCKSQMAVLVWGLLNHKYILRERLTKFEGEDTLKTMSKYYWDYKKCHQIHNGIMIFHGFPRSTCNNLMPYLMNNWWEKKKLRKYNNMFFSLFG